MSGIYSSPAERAKDEYWLNQDRISMTTEERIQRHRCDCTMALVEAIDKLRESIESDNNLDFVTKLYNIKD
jgi:hypothetical protein